MKCIVWLGNPWTKYTNTRHNIGFVMLDLFVEKHDGSWSYNNSFGAEIATIQLWEEKLIFAKPQLYMNLSGWPTQQLLSYYKSCVEDLLVLHDEIDLSLGVIQYKVWWSHAWHNGLKDIILKAGSPDFHRIRIGVGRPEKDSPISVSDYVLGSLSKEDFQLFEQKYDIIQDMIYQFIWYTW